MEWHWEGPLRFPWLKYDVIWWSTSTHRVENDIFSWRWFLDSWSLSSLKLTKTSLQIGIQSPKGKDRIPTIHFQVLLLLVWGRFNSTRVPENRAFACPPKKEGSTFHRPRGPIKFLKGRSCFQTSGEFKNRLYIYIYIYIYRHTLKIHGPWDWYIYLHLRAMLDPPKRAIHRVVHERMCPLKRRIFQKERMVFQPRFFRTC